MEEFWVKMKNGIKDGASFSATKIEQYSKIGKLKVEQFGHNKKIETIQNDIGVRLYDLIKDEKGNSADSDIAIASFIEQIDEHKAEIVQLDEQIEMIRLEALEKQESAQAEAELRDAENVDISDVDEDEALGI
jgi:hypothetical protein